MRALMAVQWMAGVGVALDWPRWEAFARDAAEAQGALLAELKECADINWQSNPQVMKYFVAKGAEIANTQAETLAALDDPVAALLVRYRGYQKLTSTYGLNWAAYLHEGRIHADWWQIETRTGRMSCKNPNLQNVPRFALDSPHRACIVAPDGRVLVKCDYSQLELRAAAQIANEPTMLRAFHDGTDLHKLTAARVTGKPITELTKADRQMAKAINFGFLFGMGANKFQAYAATNYGVEMSGAEAFNAREAFFSLYPKLRDWHSTQGGKWESPPIDTFTVLGRRRKEVKFFAERLNSPIQGTGGDGIKNALALLWEHPLADDIFPVLCVHDEIVVEAPAERGAEALDWLTGYMKLGMAAYLTDVPVEVEATIARNWAGGE
jgi:DNA polymerase-1